MGVEMDVSGIDTAGFLMTLTKDQSSVLILKFSGYKPWEIVKILKFKSIRRYYKINHSLRVLVEKTKTENS